ncbi:MAG: hypothetical protein R2720_09945 [Candidatus Nanopelagicales bacterium]
MGTLKVKVRGTGSYTVKGKGFRKTRRVSKAFKVKPGTYRVKARRGSATPAKVRIRKGKTVRVTVKFKKKRNKTVAGAIQRISTTKNGTQANDLSDPAKWSPRGDRIAFYSLASNLVNGDTNDAFDLFVKNLANGAVQRVNVDKDGRQANDVLRRSSTSFSWSPDGTRIAFASKASNLVPGDTNQTSDVFVKDLASGAIQRISTDSNGNGATSPCSACGSYDPAWSPDGRRIAFYSGASNLVPGDTNGRDDIFVKDLDGGAVTRITDIRGREAVYYAAEQPAWSPDGTRIAFLSRAANLVPGDTNGSPDIFVKNLDSGVIDRINTDSNGNEAAFLESDWPVWSPDGTRIAFLSRAANLVPGDTNGLQDVFVKDLATGAIQRINTDKDGRVGNMDVETLAWSPSGERIAFSSAAWNLLPGDTNRGIQQHVYVKDLATGAIQRVSTDKHGVPSAWGTSLAPSWSPDGRRISFSSDAADLVPGDTNGEGDIFIKTLP